MFCWQGLWVPVTINGNDLVEVTAAYSLARFWQIEQQYHLTKAQLVEKQAHLVERQAQLAEKQAQLAQESTRVALDESEVAQYKINLRGFDWGLCTAVERLNRAKCEYCNIKMICNSHSVGGDTTNKTADPTCDLAVSYTNQILGDHNWHQMWCTGRRYCCVLLQWSLYPVLHLF